MLTLLDDVPCTYLRPSPARWQRSSYFLGEDQGELWLCLFALHFADENSRNTLKIREKCCWHDLLLDKEDSGRGDEHEADCTDQENPSIVLCLQERDASSIDNSMLKKCAEDYATDRDFSSCVFACLPRYYSSTTCLLRQTFQPFLTVMGSCRLLSTEESRWVSECVSGAGKDTVTISAATGLARGRSLSVAVSFHSRYLLLTLFLRCLQWTTTSLQ